MILKRIQKILNYYYTSKPFNNTKLLILFSLNLRKFLLSFPRLTTNPCLRKRTYLHAQLRLDLTTHIQTIFKFQWEFKLYIYILLYHLNQFDKSQVTGLLDLSKYRMCPGSQVPLTKSPGETQKKTQKNRFFGKIINKIFEGLSIFFQGHRSQTNLLNSKFCQAGHRSHPLSIWIKWYSIVQ